MPTDISLTTIKVVAWNHFLGDLLGGLFGLSLGVLMFVVANRHVDAMKGLVRWLGISFILNSVTRIATLGIWLGIPDVLFWTAWFKTIATVALAITTTMVFIRVPRIMAIPKYGQLYQRIRDIRTEVWALNQKLRLVKERPPLSHKLRDLAEQVSEVVQEVETDDNGDENRGSGRALR